jgi:DNA-binding transcriptional regulator YiaG
MSSRLFKSKDRPTLEQIGEQVGNVSRQYVSLVLREAGLLAEESEHIDVTETVAEIQKLSGWSQTDIGAILKVARETVNKWAGGQKASTSRARQFRLLAQGLKYAAKNRAVP